ncbi:MAG: hydantoinase/oxoprolinase family protein, partial [Caulobacterales bacterium]|nr:hydantoinase/oxoprolinase family protein [Caulobacterales bacterium]
MSGEGLFGFNTRPVRIGVDVGGTNTDAVVMRDDKVVASCKRATTEDVSRGVVDAITEVLSQGRVKASDVSAVMVGTTHFTNALVQRRSLERTGVLRIGAPAAAALPPLIDWPTDLVAAIEPRVAMIGGAHHYDGSVSAPLDEAAVIEAARAFQRDGVAAIAVSAVFAPVNDAMEARAGEILRNELPDARVTLSSKIGRIGLLERENAGIVNASLARLADETVDALVAALRQAGIAAPLFISQNDGTLMSAAFVKAYPVLTIASGPTNSMRGAA